jgi:hypothetical protein
MTYTFSPTINANTQAWINATKPGPGYHQANQAIRIFDDGLVIIGQPAFTEEWEGILFVAGAS